MKNYYVYILTNRPNGVLYVGVTSDLGKRIYEHRNKLADGFTKKYNISRLVYFEQTNNVKEAILREKRMKRWKRGWKIELIENNNPGWRDLYDEIN